MKIIKPIAITAILASFALQGLAQDKAGHAQHPATPVASAGSAMASSAMADAEVRKVDKDAKKITLKHGPIKSLDMPAMTMVFQVRDTALLDKAKAGDKIKFSAEQREGAYVITAIEPAEKR